MHNSQKIWKTINKILNKANKSNNTIPNQILDNNGVLQLDLHVIRNMFNDYFAQVGPSMAKDIPPAKHNYINNISSTPYSFYLKPVTQEEIIHHLQNLNTSKSTTTNDIPIKFIKIAARVTAPILTKLYNTCISEGSFTNILKLSQIILTHKKGPKNLCFNYRPISLLSPFSKIFEKCIYSQLIDYLNKKKLITNCEYGFRSNYSCSMAVSKISSEIIKNTDDKKTTCSIFLDLAKAFDTVDHEILLNKLKLYGIRGIPHQMISSYLSNRKMFTVVNGVTSNNQNITCGVPQGSTLGPLLFTLYVNDLPLATNFDVKLFADDTNLTMSNYNVKDLQTNVNNELENIVDWMRSNKLSLNFTKTEFLLITKAKCQKSFEIKINGHAFQPSSYAKYLGVYIDDKLTWKKHVNTVCSKIGKDCWALARLRNYVNQKTLLKVYHAMIQSHIQYCISTWGAASQSTLYPVIKLQNRALRIITSSAFNAHSSPLFKNLNLLKINDIHKLEVCKHMHRVNSKDCAGVNPSAYNSLDKISNYGTRRRLNGNYFLKSTNSKFVRTNIEILGPKYWANVPSDLKIYSLQTFTKQYKRYLISHY